MRTCKVRAPRGRCAKCRQEAARSGSAVKCCECAFNRVRYELLEIVGEAEHALVKRGGKIIKVPLSEVYDVKSD